MIGLPAERPLRAGSVAWLRSVLLVLIGTAILTFSAKVQVPFWPVPMTLQTGAVLLLGVTLGPRLAMATVALYLVEGAVGLPVFAGTPVKGIGLAYMAGPTGGYLVSFLFAAGIAGLAADQVGWLKRSGLLLLAVLVNYALGVAWLSTFVGLPTALAVGAWPFVPGDGLKLLLALAVVQLIRAHRDKGRRPIT